MVDSSPATQQSARVGVLIAGRYELSQRIARGGMAEVWRGHDTVLARPVAVKILLDELAADAENVARFRREAVVAGRLNHPAIVSVYDTSTDPHAIVMELVEGRTLRDELDDHPLQPPERVIEVGIAVCEALDAAHRTSLVHRDIKPANILITAEGQIRVGDFGIAKPTHADEGADLTREGMMVGTAKYLAPEQITGAPSDGRADLYALGVVLFEMLCGRPPFKGETDLACATARLTSAPPRVRDIVDGVPRALEDVIARSLQVDPDGRWDTAARMRQALVQCRESPTAALSRPDRVESARTRSEPASRPAAAATDVTATSRLDGSADTETDGPSSRRRRIGRWALVALTAAAALVGAQLLVDGLGPFGAGADPGVEMSIEAIASFDPDRTDGERDDLLELAIDGDIGTAWRTEGYRAPITDQKSGVGIVVQIGDVAELTRLEIDSVANSWGGAVYVSLAPQPSLSGWGNPVAELDDVGHGRTTIDLGGRLGGAVLIWFTDLGDEWRPTHMYVNEVRLRGYPPD